MTLWRQDKMPFTVIKMNCSFKGTVAWDFCPLVLFINRPNLGLCLLYKNVFEFCFEFAEFFEFEFRTALWATAENQILFEDALRPIALNQILRYGP